jgi:hypothetical protein
MSETLSSCSYQLGFGSSGESAVTPQLRHLPSFFFFLLTSPLLDSPQPTHLFIIAFMSMTTTPPQSQHPLPATSTHTTPLQSQHPLPGNACNFHAYDTPTKPTSLACTSHACAEYNRPFTSPFNSRAYAEFNPLPIWLRPRRQRSDFVTFRRRNVPFLRWSDTREAFFGHFPASFP